MDDALSLKKCQGLVEIRMCAHRKLSDLVLTSDVPKGSIGTD